MTIRAIETEYAGCRFRSRTEARWAVFFDVLGLSWEYEPEGFDLGSIRYLPDFYVDGVGWLEIKPAKEPTELELKKCSAFATNIETMYMLLGAPQLPKIEYGQINPLHFGGMKVVRGSAAIMFGKVETDPPHSVIESRPHCWHQRVEDGSFLLWPVPAWEVVGDDEADFFVFLSLSGKDVGLPMAKPFKHKKLDSPDLVRAYKAARSARFEFGESGYRRSRKVWNGLDWGEPQVGELPY